jgi:hypothetical protein
MRPSGTSHLRIARPTPDLARIERFWAAVGLEVLWRSDPASGHDLVMLGLPGAAWHLELVLDDLAPTPTEEDLVVIYLDGPVDPQLVTEVEAAGGTRVTARNPYWEQWGVTLQDPDGYRLVLSTRAWSD